MKNDRSVLLEYLKRFAGQRILVVGDLMMDRYMSGSVERISPEAPVPVVKIGSEERSPGGAANVASLLVALGIEVSLHGVVGDDFEGCNLLEQLTRRGVFCENVRSVPQYSTTVKTRVVSSRQQLLRFDHESDSPLDSQLISEIAAGLRAQIPEYSAVIISDYGKGVIVPPVIETISDVAAENNIIVAVDPKLEHFFSYKNVSVITPNNSEASAAVGYKIKDIESLSAAGEKIMQELSPQYLLITRSEQGMALFEAGNGLYEIPAHVREVYDVTGAGDMVIAVFTAALVCGASGKEAAVLANYAAGLEVGHFGCQPISLEELQEALQNE